MLNIKRLSLDIPGSWNFLLESSQTGSREDIEAALGMKMGARALTVRDFCKEKEIEFSSVKTELQTKVDALE